MSNTNIHRQLAKIYGNKCMFLAAHCDTAHFRKFTQKYTSKELKKLINTITVHHFKHRAEGGKTAEYNCSLVCELAHIYIHSLSRKDEEKINKKIKDYKKRYKKCKVEFTDEIPNLEFRCGIISPHDLSKSKNNRNKNSNSSKNKRKMTDHSNEYTRFFSLANL